MCYFGIQYSVFFRLCKVISINYSSQEYRLPLPLILRSVLTYACKNVLIISQPLSGTLKLLSEYQSFRVIMTNALKMNLAYFTMSGQKKISYSGFWGEGLAFWFFGLWVFLVWFFLWGEVM